MAFETASFDPKEFELRNYTNPYLTPEQTADVTLVENRVNSQLDFLAQSLGWNGPNYWTDLPDTVNQKRQLLGGSFGVYNGFFIPRVIEIRNWDNIIVVDRIPFIRPGQQIYVEQIILGDDTYKIQSLTVERDYYLVSLGVLPQKFYDQIAANEQIKISIPTLRPAPFYRGDVGIAGDASFNVKTVISGTVCGSKSISLSLYPGYDTDYRFAYDSLCFFVGSVYYFDQPVYIKYNLSNTEPDISPTYDADKGVWYLRIANDANTTVPVQVYLCQSVYDEACDLWMEASSEVLVESWQNNSDWGDLATLELFTGTWGNKGGSLPFNFSFDSLSLHGVSEVNALVLNQVNASLSYNDLMSNVYCQLTPYDVTAPGDPENGDLWWNPATGVLAVWYAPENQECRYWVEIDYRQQPEQAVVPSLVYPDVATFTAATIADGTIVQILDCTGLTTTSAGGIIGLSGTITSACSLILYKEIGSPYWTCYSFTFANEADFAADAAVLPFKVPCTISDATGIAPTAPSYNVGNLDFQILQPVPAVLSKIYTNDNWEITPDSILRYISNSSLFGYELQGEMWWDYANPVYATRAASIYIQSAWVSVNYHPLSGPPVYNFDVYALRFYADGNLLTNGVDFVTTHYIIRYTFNETTNNYDFVYTPIDLVGQTQLPTITVSDNLEGTYVEDVSNLVFGGITYYLSPSVADAEVPLRLWQTEELQDVGNLLHYAENNYINPLIADQNNGPNLPNWERYFVRLPLDYSRNGVEWQKSALICQDFGYWGTTIVPEFMRCPPEDDRPAIYEELFLYDEPIRDYTYVYTEPYLYSNIAYFDGFEVADYSNAGVFPGNEIPFDGYDEGYLSSYEPLHNRQADVTSPMGAGYGDWDGVYTNVNPCLPLSGFFVNDVEDGALDPVAAPVWDASIYKWAPTCEHDQSTYSVDSNHYKLGYAYFVADASAAEEGFFDPQQQSAWRYPRYTYETDTETREILNENLVSRTLYLTPKSLNSPPPIVNQGAF